MSNMMKLKFPFVVLSISLIIAGCQNYYKVNKNIKNNTLSKEQVLDSLKDDRYFILRSGDNAWHMKNMLLNDDQKTLTCILDSVSYLHKLHFGLGYKGNMRYKKSRLDHIQVLNEVHLFIPEDGAIASGSYSLPLDKVQKIEVIEKDKARTTNSYVLGAIGTTLGAMALVGIVILATKSSCPFVSAYDSGQF